MDFSLSETQEMLKKTARDFLSTECPTSVVKKLEQQGEDKAYLQQLWRKMAELGWLGLPFPEQYGGTGGNFADLVILLEEMGAVCLPGPYFSTVVLGGMAIMEAGREEQKKRLLAEVTKGDCILTVAINEPDARYTPDSIMVSASKKGDNYVIKGTKLFVPDAHVANYIICVARTGNGEKDISLLILDAKSAGVKLTPLVTSIHDSQFEVTFSEVEVTESAILGEVNQGWEAVEKLLQKANAAKCAEMMGGAQRVLEMTTEYAKQRVQFDHPIGSFQSVQHHLSNMLIDVEGSRWMTYQACCLISEGIPCQFEVSAAKAWVSEAYRRVTALGQQIHGGVGFILDHDMPLYYKRAKQWESLFGDSDSHRELVARELGM